MTEIGSQSNKYYADPELCYFVNEIRLFGSARDSNAQSFGDIDIAYDLGRRKRPPEYKDWHDWSRKRWEIAGRHNLNFVQQLYYAEHEIPRLLKRRNQYLSIHNLDDLVGIGADSTRLFKPEDGESGEKLHTRRMASAKKRTEEKVRRLTEKKKQIGSLEPVISTEQSREQINHVSRSGYR